MWCRPIPIGECIARNLRDQSGWANSPTRRAGCLVVRKTSMGSTRIIPRLRAGGWRGCEAAGHFGGKRVRLQSRALHQPGLCLIKVRDDGIGRGNAIRGRQNFWGVAARRLSARMPLRSACLGSSRLGMAWHRNSYKRKNRRCQRTQKGTIDDKKPRKTLILRGFSNYFGLRRNN